jgi:alcohol dehydrogenase class IV
VAELLNGGPIENPGPDALPDVLRRLMQDIDAPRGIAELGYSEDDVPALVEGTMKQQRLLVGSPREVSENDIAHILNASMTNW